MWKLQVPRRIKTVHSAPTERRLSDVIPSLVACPPLECGCGPCMTDILREDCVKLDLETATKQQVIAELVDVLVRANRVKSKEAALTAVVQRERQGSTGLGNGIALPHGTDHYIERVTAALGVSRSGVEFDSADGKPAHVVLLLLGRTNCPQSNLHALDVAARLLHTPGLVDIALDVATPGEMTEFIHGGVWAQ